MARSRSASLKSYWRDVRSVARRTDRPIAQARGIVRELRRQELAPRQASEKQLTRALRSDAARRGARTRARAVSVAGARETIAGLASLIPNADDRETYETAAYSVPSGELAALRSEIEDEIPTEQFAEHEPATVDEWIDLFRFYEGSEDTEFEVEEHDVTADYEETAP